MSLPTGSDSETDQASELGLYIRQLGGIVVRMHACCAGGLGSIPEWRTLNFPQRQFLRDADNFPGVFTDGI